MSRGHELTSHPGQACKYFKKMKRESADLFLKRGGVTGVGAASSSASSFFTLCCNIGYAVRGRQPYPTGCHSIGFTCSARAGSRCLRLLRDADPPPVRREVLCLSHRRAHG